MSIKSSRKSSKRPKAAELIDPINGALQSSDITEICQAIGEVIRLHNVSEIARQTGIERPSLYRAFAGQQSPKFLTVLNVLDALGLRLKVVQRRASERKSRGK
jgi:probable addiction module antidote protein